MGLLSIKLGFETIFYFGKYTNETVKDVVSKDPHYIIWLEENTNHEVHKDVLLAANSNIIKINKHKEDVLLAANSKNID